MSQYSILQIFYCSLTSTNNIVLAFCLFCKENLIWIFCTLQSVSLHSLRFQEYKTEKKSVPKKSGLWRNFQALSCIFFKHLSSSNSTVVVWLSDFSLNKLPQYLCRKAIIILLNTIVFILSVFCVFWLEIYMSHLATPSLCEASTEVICWYSVGWWIGHGRCKLALFTSWVT